MRTTSSVFKLDLCRRHDFIAEMATQILRRAQVGRPAAQQARELGFHARKAKQAGFMAGFELYEQVHVAVGPRDAFQGRAEQGETPDMMASAKGSECLRIGKQGMRHWLYFPGQSPTKIGVTPSYHNPGYGLGRVAEAGRRGLAFAGDDP